MKISIIVPVYNAEKYIERCVSSIEKQSYSDYEIILINDGSVDNSGVICDKCAIENDRIKVIHQKNSGPGPSRNIGIKNATGDYILFVDSDDYIIENTFEILKKAINENDFPDAIIFDYIMGNERYSIKRNTINGEKEGFVEIKDAILNSTGGSMCKMYKSSVIKDNSITFPAIQRKEDFVFNKAALSYCESIFYVKENLYYYYNNVNSIMHTTLFSDEVQKIAFESLKKAISAKYKELIDFLIINNFLIIKARDICVNEKGVRKFKDFIKNYESVFPDWFEKSKELKISRESRLFLFLVTQKVFLCFKRHLYHQNENKKVFIMETEG